MFNYIWRIKIARLGFFEKEWKRVSSVKRDRWALWRTGMSFIYMRYNVGERQEPWGTPASIGLLLERELAVLTLNDRFDWIVEIRGMGMLIRSNLSSRPSCHTLSKAFSISSHVRIQLLYTRSTLRVHPVTQAATGFYPSNLIIVEHCVYNYTGDRRDWLQFYHLF